MHDEYKYMLLKFSASYITSIPELKKSKEDVFQIQEVYSKANTSRISFCPITFFATYIEDILKLDGVKIEYEKYTKIPKEIKIDDLLLFTFSHMNNLHMTKLYIRYHDFFQEKKFNAKAYYSLNYYGINKKYTHLLSFDIEQLAALYYVEYGYWTNPSIEYINPKQYICSYPHLMGKSDQEVLNSFFEFKDEDEIQMCFDPYIYVASNIEQLTYLIDDDLKYIPNGNNETRICKQYIREGFHKKTKIDTFDQFVYLANNPKEIKNILLENNIIYWDFFKLSKRNVAIHFIKNRNTCKLNVFNGAKFVEENVSNEVVNFDKKLSIETAPQYFILNYVKSKEIRYHMSKRYRIGLFFSQRIKDSLRTLPLSISKCLYAIPI